MRLRGLWALGGVAILAGLAVGFGGAWMFAAPVDAFRGDRYYPLASLLLQTATPLLTGGLLAVLIALATHAVLWRRARVSPRPPEPSP